MKFRALRYAALLCLLVTACPSPAYAYLDPGTGSMLLSVLIGLLSSAYFLMRKLPALFRAVLFKATGKGKLLERKHIAIYGETANYWGTFRPLLEEFGRRGEAVEYLTSSENDPCFKADLPDCITCRYIGTGNTAYTTLNFLEADALVLTTPGIDVLQIRRSKGVKKYIHVVHSLSDVHSYKLFAFDYYDAVLCSGQYQADSLRLLEAQRGTQAKELPLVGCPYMDALAARREREKDSVTPEKNCVLVAPSWGKNGMLTRYGAAVPRFLAEAGYKVILRPHPQSFISEKPLMEQLQRELAAFPNIEWDRNPDGFASLSRATVMVSDFSGVVFDFAFVFLRPVVTLAYELDKRGFDAFSLPHPSWESQVVEQLGHRLDPAELEQLPGIIEKLTSDQSFPERILHIRENNVANFGKAAVPVVDAILNIAASEE
ncbi:MAG: CDP-glycerol glycerophosphotransferase family protein [Mailhella sp.]|nr:CDP-glycerol glycerophosphotransferase family protein [Mailhella sp.]MBQ4615337.1 CDP-glycerol glycerophosphotransferase family protein [Mailhella sp.]